MTDVSAKPGCDIQPSAPGRVVDVDGDRGGAERRVRDRLVGHRLGEGVEEGVLEREAATVDVDANARAREAGDGKDVDGETVLSAGNRVIPNGARVLARHVEAGATSGEGGG